MKRWFWGLLLLAGCAGLQRDCQSCSAQELGSDWIIVQYSFDGTPINCWVLKNKGVSNEPQSDGILWVSDKGHLVHISGWYSRVQVQSGDWKGAAVELGINFDQCKDGRYLPPADAGH